MARTPLRRTTAMLFAAVVAVVALAIGGPAQAHDDHGSSSHHGHHDDRLRVTINGGGSVESIDATPSFSGSVSPTDGLTSLEVDAKFTSSNGPAVTCAASADTAAGTWACTAGSDLKPGWHRLTVQIKATYEDGHSSKDKATQNVLVTRPEPPKEATPEPEPIAEAPKEATPEPEPSPEPTLEPPAKPESRPSPAVTADPEPASIDKPTTKPKPRPEPRQQEPASKPVPLAAPKPVVLAVEPAPLHWSFRVFNEEGVDITGAPLRMGDQITIVADHLPAGASVALEIHSTPMALGSGSAGSDGTLALAIAIPVMEVGEHTLVATLSAPGYADSVAERAVHVDEVLELQAELDAPPPADPPAIEPVTPEPAKDSDTRGFDDDHEGIADSLQSIFDINAAPWKFAATGSLAAALVLLAALPAELLQSTLSENYGRAFGWLEPARRRLALTRVRRQRKFAVNPWLGGLFTVAVAAFVLGFAQDGYGFNRESLMSFAALFLSLFMLNIAVNAVRMGVAWKRLRLPGRLVPMPGALVVAAISVIVSRVLDLNPALLFGLVVGVHFVRTQSTRIAGKLALVAVSSVLALGLAAWVLFSIVVNATGDTDSVLIELIEETLAATTLESLSVLLVALLPFQFLEGKHLHDWNQRVWALMYLLAASAFVFIAVPLGDSWEEARQPLGTWLSLLAGFTVIAIAAWALFRFVPEQEGAEQHEKAHH